MRRVALILAAVVCASAVAIVGLGASGSDGGAYQVRAIFDSAFSVIPGEDVRVAGVTVGAIKSLDVTPDNKAAVVLEIDKSGFADFRRDATCDIRPQSLIGERFVECTPTQPRTPGTPAPPPLATVPKGQPGAGQHLLPVSQTGRQVDLDLVNNIMRLPYRERLSVLLNEFGTGLAGNGAALNQAIRNANPALRETDRVLAIIASQNKVLADLARNSDTDLAPLADRRQQVADFVVKANTVAQATAVQQDNLQKQFEKFPPALRQLNLTLGRLGNFADQATPVVTDLRAEAPSLTRFAKALGPFSAASIPAFQTLGQAAEIGKVAVPKTLPITQQIAALAQEAQPLAQNLRSLLESFRDTGGVERLMDYIFFQVAAINGFDQAGHYLRAGLIVNTCSTYVTAPTGGCQAKFGNGAAPTAGSGGSSSGSGASARAAAAHPTGDPTLDRPARILSLIAQGIGADAAVRQVLGAQAQQLMDQRLGVKPPATRTRHRRATGPRRHAARRTPLRLPPALSASGSQQTAATAAPAVQPESTAPPQPSAGATGTLLDYLLGGGS